MKRAQPLVMITIWNSHKCLCQPVPCSGGKSGLALTRWQITWPPVASAREVAAVPVGRSTYGTAWALSRTCPWIEPVKRAKAPAGCLIFDLELLDVGRLGFGRLDPLGHFRHGHDGFGVGRKFRLEF